MKETIELIFRWLKAYVGTGWHWLLFLAAAVLLFFLREASKKRQILAGYCIGILFLYFFPLTAWIIMKACIGTDTYWRMFWLLPVTPVIAYVLVLAVQRAEKRGRAEGIAAAAACVLLIAVTGSCVYGKGQFTTGNRFKLNGDMMAVCNFLEDYNTDDEIYASVPPEFVSYIRQYDANIKQPYGRYGPEDWQPDQQKIEEIYKENPVDFFGLTSVCKKLGINYIIYPHSEEAAAAFTQDGYALAGTVGKYGIYHNPAYGSEDDNGNQEEV